MADVDTERPAKAAKVEKTSTAKGINKVLVALLAAAIVLLVQQWGQPDATGEEQAAPHGDMSGVTAADLELTEPLDEERVAELQSLLDESPEDVAALRELATLHNDAGLWDEAAGYHEQVLGLEPTDVDTLLALGVIRFNLGDLDAAEESWLAASDVDPTLPEPYFNLGFIHLSREPADKDRARAMWEKLIEVAPDSSLAQTAQSHIDGATGED